MKKITSVIIMYLLVLTLSSASFAHEKQNVSGQVLTEETPENLINSSKTSADKDELISKDITDSLYDIPLNKTIMNENALVSAKESAYLTMSNKTSSTKNLNIQDSHLSLLANKVDNAAQKKKLPC